MGDLKLTTVEEMEAATARLLETGAKVGADVLHRRHREVSADVTYMVS